MLVALHDPTNYDDVETALNTTVESMTVWRPNEKEKVDAEKFIHQHGVSTLTEKVKRIGNAIVKVVEERNCMLWRQNGKFAVPSDCTFRQREWSWRKLSKAR